MKLKLAELFIGVFFLALISCNSQAQKSINKSEGKSSTIEKVVKDEKVWKEELTEMEYYVLREKGTERSFTGDLWDNKKEGIYTCAGCELPLFHSDTKYKSGTGWPSFWQPLKEEHIAEDVDFKIGYKRVEVLCSRCDGHLGHVFPDGPEPTGLRYCINSVSLNFEEHTEATEK